MSNLRIEWIDITKGLGIILVIAGHTFALGYSAPIYSFHMPLFFFLSGLVFNNVKYNTFWKMAIAKCLQLLKPYVVFYIISLCVCITIPIWRDQLSLKQMIIELYTTNSNNINNSSIWYLICLYVMFVMAFPVIHFLDKMKPHIRFISIVTVGILLLWLKDILSIISPDYIVLIDNRLPFKMDSAAIALFFFIIGYYYKKKIVLLIAKTTWLSFIIVGMLFLVGFLLNRWSNINSMDFGRIRLLYYPIAFAGIYCCASFAFLLSKKKCVFVDRIKKYLSFYGVNSLIIFGFQSLLIRLYILFFNTNFGYSMELYGMNPLIHQVGSFLVVTFFLSPLVVLFFGYLKRKGINII